MGRNKFAQDEINEIARLLRLKNAGNRARQKLVRHDLRTVYEFNISDFNEPGRAERERQAIEAGEMTDWKASAREWEEWEKSQQNGD